MEETWSSFKETTIRTYRNALCRIINWSERRGLRDTKRYDRTDEEIITYIIDNITDDRLRDYFEAALDDNVKSEQLCSEMQAVRWIFREKATDNIFLSKSTDYLNSHISIRYAQRKRIVAPIYWSDVDKICKTISSDKSMSGYRDLVLIKILSDCLLRVSEAIQLDVDDIKGLNVTFDGVKLPIGYSTNNSLETYKRFAGIKDGALFRNAGKGYALRNERLGIQGARTALKNRMRAAGIDRPYSGTAFRVGSIVELLEAKAPLADIQRLARFKNIGSIISYVDRIKKEDDLIKHYKYDKGDNENDTRYRSLESIAV